MQKTGDVFLTNEKKRCVAYWRPVDGSPDVSLCAMDLDTYSKHLHLRKMFIELAGEIAVNRERPSGSAVTLRTREPTTKSIVPEVAL